MRSGPIVRYVDEPPLLPGILRRQVVIRARLSSVEKWATFVLFVAVPTGVLVGGLLTAFGRLVFGPW